MAKNSQRCCIPFSNLCLYSDKVIAEEWEYMMLLFNWDFETTLWNVRIRPKLIKNKHELTMISCCLGVQAPHGAQLHTVLLMWLINWITRFITKVNQLLTSLQKCYWLHYQLNYWFHYKRVTDFITNSITDHITKVLLISLQTQLLTLLQKYYWLHYKSVTDFITDWLCCKVIITNANNVLNGHSDTYFGPPAGLILFLKIIPDRMSPINIIEGLGTISPIKICWECDGCAMLHLDDMHW